MCFACVVIPRELELAVACGVIFSSFQSLPLQTGRGIIIVVRSEAECRSAYRIGRIGSNILSPPDEGGASSTWCSTPTAEPRHALAKEGATAAGSLDEVVKTLGEKPRAVWLMLPAGDHRRDGRTSRRPARRDDIIIDGGNSFYKDDIRRAKKLAEKGIRYVDCGTSGGVWGIERGYCMMIGGPKAAVDHLDPIFSALAPGLGDISRTPDREKGTPRRARLHSRRPVRRRALRQDGA